MILKVFTRPWKIKYSDTYLLAILVSSSYRYHPDLAVQVVDDTMEQIVSGLEMNSFSDNQKRISQVRYLAELYVYKVVDSTLIFETLHRLVSFGRGKFSSCSQIDFTLLTHLPGPGSAESEGSNEIDLPDDFFRIQLICNILQVCGTCFARGSAAKRLDDFIILFQVSRATGINSRLRIADPDAALHSDERCHANRH